VTYYDVGLSRAFLFVLTLAVSTSAVMAWKQLSLK